MKRRARTHPQTASHAAASTDRSGPHSSPATRQLEAKSGSNQALHHNAESSSAALLHNAVSAQTTHPALSSIQMKSFGSTVTQLQGEESNTNVADWAEELDHGGENVTLRGAPASVNDELLRGPSRTALANSPLRPGAQNTGTAGGAAASSATAASAPRARQPLSAADRADIQRMANVEITRNKYFKAVDEKKGKDEIARLKQDWDLAKAEQQIAERMQKEKERADNAEIRKRLHLDK